MESRLSSTRPAVTILKNQRLQKECSICNNFMLQPVKLVCNHYFCAACINRLEASQTKELLCPLCRVPFKVVKNGQFNQYMIDNDYADALKEKFPTLHETQSENLQKTKGALLAPEELDFVGIKVAYGLRHWNATEVGKEESKQVLALFVEILEDKIRPLTPFLIESVSFTPSQGEPTKTSTDRTDGIILHQYTKQEQVQIQVQFNKDLVQLAQKKSNQRESNDPNQIMGFDDLSKGHKVFEFVKVETTKAGDPQTSYGFMRIPLMGLQKANIMHARMRQERIRSRLSQRS